MLSQSREFVANLKLGNYYDFGVEEDTEPPTLNGYNPQEKAGSDANSKLLIKVGPDLLIFSLVFLIAVLTEIEFIRHLVL